MEQYTTPKTDVNEIEILHDFYTYQLAKENDKKELKLTISKPNFIRLLKRLNFCKYYINGQTASYIYIKNNRAVPVSDDIIFSELTAYIKNLPDRKITVNLDKETVIDFTITPERIIDALINNSGNLSNKVTFYFLNFISNLEFQCDLLDTKFFYFNNCVVKLHKGSEITTLDYSDLSKKVWENNIINRDFTYSKRKGDFEQFFEKITGYDSERKKSLMSMMGYLLHNYFNYDLFAIYLTDVNADFTERAGGTGKGILYKALREMLNRDIQKNRIFVRIDGDSFDKKNERRYSDVDVDTQVVCIDDIKKNSRPDTFITDITEGVSVRKMYADSFYQNVKFLITTNFAPDFNNASDRRRAKIFELSNYYSDKLRPSDEFKKWFFGVDWDSAEWNEFYSFMINCSNEYIQKGVTEASDINFSERSIFDNTCDDFVFWINAQIADVSTSATEKMFVKDDFYRNYMEKYSDTLNVYKKPKNKFFEWVRVYCRKKAFPYSEFRSTDDEFYFFPTSDTMKKCLEQRNKKC
ncbi:MAG: hypothetical protein LBS50_08270 [Prevotellaceae bacterium]|jgi:hypothetical protein|nr:hypothetical protein [Prevotellaceae bacterium]